MLGNENLYPNVRTQLNNIKYRGSTARLHFALKNLPKIKGVKEILYPGQGIYSRYKRNLKKGIVIPKNILEDIKKLNVIK